MRPVSRLFVSLLAPAVALTLAPAEQKCDRALARALERPAGKRLVALEKAEERCSEHMPTVLAVASTYLVRGSGAGERWIEKGLERFARVLETEPDNVQARWGAAFLLEYGGAYGHARPHFAWLAEHQDAPGMNAAASAEARGHEDSCGFLARLAALEGQARETPGVPGEEPAGDQLSFTDDAIRERAAFGDLRKAAAAVGVAGGLGSMGADYRYVETALGLLDDWSRRPTAYPVLDRAVLLSGMVQTLGDMVHRHGLGEKVGQSMETFASGDPAPWPDGTLDTGLAEGFRAQPAAPGRSFLVFPNLDVTVKWAVPDISGEWTYRQMAPVCSEYFSFPARTTRVTIEQDGPSVTFGSPPFKCRIEGGVLECSRSETLDRNTVLLTLRCEIVAGDTLPCGFVARGKFLQQSPIQSPAALPVVGEWRCEGSGSLRREADLPG